MEDIGDGDQSMAPNFQTNEAAKSILNPVNAPNV
jgi:hypothetical protein